jgi:hypothetical protein
MAKLVKPIDRSLNDGGGKYVIKKNNFIMNRRPTSKTNARSNLNLSDEDEQGGNEQNGIFDTMDLGDLDNIDLDDANDMMKGSQSTVRIKKTVSKTRMTVPSQELDLIDENDRDLRSKYRNQKSRFDQFSDQDPHQRTIKRPLNIKDASLQFFSNSRPLKTTTKMTLKPNKGYFVSEQSVEDEEISRAINTYEPQTAQRPVLGHGQMRVVRGQMDMRASDAERLQIETHVTQNLKLNTSGTARPANGAVSASPQVWESRVKEERVNFLAHLLTGEPMRSKATENKDKNYTGFDALDGEKKPKKPDTAQKDIEASLQESERSPKEQNPLDRKDSASPEVRNKGFFDKIHEHALKLKAKEREKVAKKFGKDEDESGEDSISDAEIDNPIDPEDSVHSIHDSVAYEYKHRSEYDMDLEDKMAILIQRAYRKRANQKDYSVKKQVITKEHLLFVSRFFRRVEYRKSFNQSETFVHFILTFKIQRRYPPGQKGLKPKLLDLDSQPEFEDPTLLVPILHISLKNKRNFLLNSEKAIDVERFMVDRTGANMASMLSLPRLQMLSRLLADNLYVVDDDIHFHQSLTLLVNSPC